MQRYDSYKDSGIYFLPNIPQSWQVLKAKYLFKQEKRAVRPTDEIVTCFRDGQVTLRRNRRTEGYTNSLKEIGYQGVRKGDLVIHNMDAFAGAIGVSDSDGKGTPVYSCCTAIRDDINQYYYCYLLRYLARNGFILSLAKGIRERSTDFRFADFKELYLPVPSLREQDAIVSYINTQCAKIDEAIAQQQKMIDLLNERKQIIINNAVTKGLNPNAKMKPSGIDWIGNIPEHWGTRAIKFLFNQRNEYNTPIKTSERLSLSIDKGVTLYSEKTTNLDRFKEDVSQYKVTYPNDIILNSMNMIVGAVGLSKYMGCVSPAYYVIYASTKIDVFYYSYLLNIRSIRAVYRVLGRGIYSIDRGDGRVNTCRLKVPYGDFSRIEVPLPPYEEQKQISLYLKSQQKRIDIKIEMCNKQIALLQERKQIIINDVVTGKVKVSKK
ncbi:MAG: restriction endonuclease subunit S [Bacteroidales bacterium]|nr:restriction endonuclease subunit S [Candidatus Scybalousia scybalohippi]